MRFPSPCLFRPGEAEQKKTLFTLTPTFLKDVERKNFMAAKINYHIPHLYSMGELV